MQRGKRTVQSRLYGVFCTACGEDKTAEDKNILVDYLANHSGIVISGTQSEFTVTDGDGSDFDSFAGGGSGGDALIVRQGAKLTLSDKDGKGYAVG